MHGNLQCEKATVLITRCIRSWTLQVKLGMNSIQNDEPDNTELRLIAFAKRSHLIQR